MTAIAGPPHVVILAWGEGRRMGVGRPKALYPIFFRPMVRYVLDAAAAIEHGALSLLGGACVNVFR